MKVLLIKITTVLTGLLFTCQIYAQKVNSKTSSISFFSHTVAEDINANNTSGVSVLDATSGELVFSVPMQSFEFEKTLMQKHFNSPKFLDTKEFPKAKLIGRITNISQISFTKDGTYTAEVSGDLTIKGVTKPFSTKALITVKSSNIRVESKFDIVLAEYGIAFENGKPSRNISKTIQTTVLVEY